MARLKKSLGQHLLADPRIQRRIVEALEPGPDDEVLEIGPGTGALTRHLVGRVGRLVLVELDPGFADALRTRYGDRPDVLVVTGDILRTAPAQLVENWERTKVVGNIPYGITSPLLAHLLEPRPRPARLVLTLQKEVAERLAAPPGSKTYGALTVGVRAVADVEVLFRIPRHAFRPAPKVDSATVRITPHRPPRLTPEEEADLRTLCRVAFAHRRKQILNTLRHRTYGLEATRARTLLEEVGIPPTARPETLDVDRLLALARALRHPRNSATG
jgi:16S rRNA (adenine1518-N6/adenine1519-N6)-dimethyltransferase